MADFSVGNYSDLIDNLNPQIAAGAPKVDFSGLERLPKSYFEGLDQKAKNDLRNVFKSGVPQNSDGSPDYGSMAKQLYQLGNVGEGNNLSNIDIQRQQLKLGQDVSARLGSLENGGQPPLSVPQVAPGSSGQPIPPSVSNNGVRPQQPQAQPQPQQQPQGAQPIAPSGAYKGGDSGNSVAGLVMSRVPPELAGQLINEISAKAGVDPNEPLTDPAKRQRAIQVAQAVLSQRQNGQDGQQPNSPPPGASAPSPQAVPPQQPQAPQPQPAGPQGAYPPTAPNRGSFPTGVDPEIQSQMARLTQIFSNPALPQPVRDAAKARLEFMQKQAETTNEQKNYDLSRRQGYQGSFEQFQSDQKMQTSRAGKQGEQFAAQYQQVQDLGQKAFQELPQLEAVQKLMNDPNFYSGVGEKYNLFFKRALAAVGGDPNSAVPQEAFRKVISGSILNSLGMLKGLGQIRVAEINLAKEASASADNTPGGNRMLIEIAKRTYQHSQDVAELARNYNGGNLDAGFDKVVTQYNREHPLFNDSELKNPKLLTLPQFGSPQEVSGAKLPKGTQFRVQGTDQVRVVP